MIVFEIMISGFYIVISIFILPLSVVNVYAHKCDYSILCIHFLSKNVLENIIKIYFIPLQILHNFIGESAQI